VLLPMQTGSAAWPQLNGRQQDTVTDRPAGPNVRAFGALPKGGNEAPDVVNTQAYSLKSIGRHTAQLDTSRRSYSIASPGIQCVQALGLSTGTRYTAPTPPQNSAKSIQEHCT
jgi:hypothetical protein